MSRSAVPRGQYGASGQRRRYAQYSRQPDTEEFKNYMQECLHFLQQEGYQSPVLLGAYVSYMTGLYYHRHGEKPEPRHIYFCLPEVNNRFDANAMGVYSRQKRIAYVPRDLSSRVAEHFAGKNTHVVMVCYCTGFNTTRSSQCFYNVYAVQAPLVQPVPHHVPLPSPMERKNSVETGPSVCRVCSQCIADCALMPCRHHVCCTSCLSKVQLTFCPLCQSPVKGINKLI